MTPFLQVLLELNENFIDDTFKLCSLSKTSSPEFEDSENPISVFTTLMISLNGYIPTQMRVSLNSSNNMKRHC